MGKEVSPQDDYLRRTSKLIPAEAIAAFVTLSNGVIAARVGDPEGWIIFGLALIIGLVGLPLMLSKINDVKSAPQYLITITAFFMWVLAVHYEHLPNFTDNHSLAVAAGSLGLGLLTFFVPLVFKGSQ